MTGFPDRTEASSGRADLIALLGRRDTPTDALEDYCRYLAAAIEGAGHGLELVRMDWPARGWLIGLRELKSRSVRWRGSWVLVQYTALSWSNRGFPIRVLAVLRVLRQAGARIAVVFHDCRPAGGTRLIDRARTAAQRRVMRWCYHLSEKSILTVPVANVDWLPHDHERATFVPIGANLPPATAADAAQRTAGRTRKRVAVFGVTGGDACEREVADISYALRTVSERGIAADLAVVGRGSAEAQRSLANALAASGVRIDAKGVVPATEIAAILAGSDAFLFVRGHISTRRGSALAAIACEVPIVAYSGPETAPPLEQSGVILVPEGDRAAMGDALARVLSDAGLRTQLRERNRIAQREWFAWEAIARRILACLGLSYHPRAG